jgi:hypothetical protein
MKKIIMAATFMFVLGMANQVMAQNFPQINASKGTFDLYMGDDDTPLIYGYETADASSKKLICFSSMTADVEGNPHKCSLGAYYTTDEIEVQYIATEGSFVKLKFISQSKSSTIFYIEKKFVKFS